MRSILAKDRRSRLSQASIRRCKRCWAVENDRVHPIKGRFEMLEILNENAGAITAIATVVLALLTTALWVENRALRKAGSNPYITAYLRPHPDGTGGVQFVLANVGKGPAFDVKFSILADWDDFEMHKVLFQDDEDRAPISAVPESVEFHFLFGISFELARNRDDEICFLKPFDVSVAYADALGRKHRSNCTIDLKQFSGLKGVLAKSNDKQIADSLSKIDKHLAAISKQSPSISPVIQASSFTDRVLRWLKGR